MIILDKNHGNYITQLKSIVFWKLQYLTGMGGLGIIPIYDVNPRSLDV